MVSPNKETGKPSPNKGRNMAVEGTSKSKEIKQEVDEDERKGWTPKRVEILMQCLEQAKALVTGNVEGRNFCPKMSQIAAVVRRHSGYDFNDNQVKNYWARLKRLHGAFQKLMKQTGITCDPVGGLVEAEDQTWEEVLLPISYNEVKSIRKNGFPLFLRVDALIGDTRASGNRKHPSSRSPSHSDSSDDPIIVIKEEMSGASNVESMMSGEKRNQVAYQQGGSSGGKKKKKTQHSEEIAILSNIAQCISMRSSSKQSARTQHSAKDETIVQVSNLRQDRLKEAMNMRKSAKLLPAETGKCLKLFNDPQTGGTWVETFLNIEPEEWQGILETM